MAIKYGAHPNLKSVARVHSSFRPERPSTRHVMRIPASDGENPPAANSMSAMSDGDDSWGLADAPWIWKIAIIPHVRNIIPNVRMKYTKKAVAFWGLIRNGAPLLIRAHLKNQKRAMLNLVQHLLSGLA